MPSSAEARAIAIWGFGREGRAALDHFAARGSGAALTVLDDDPLDPGTVGRDGVRVITGPEARAALGAGAFDLVVKSPGISLYRPEIAEARAQGTRFTSAVNLWWTLHPAAKTIAVTGTKGKSTTARLLHHLLGAAGLDARLLGNVGIPALGQTPGRDWTVLELSSYQIADLDHGPDIAIVTNLHPEHAPWHGGVERYYDDKLRLLRLDARTRAFANARDGESRARLAGSDGVRWFNATDGYHVDGGDLRLRGARVETSGFPLKGAHNLANLAAAMTVFDHIGGDARRHVGALKSFRQLPHRLEELRLADDVLCVDDSISTIPEATIAALDAYPDRDVLLLLGGTERGQTYGALFDRLDRARVALVACLPPNGARIHAELRERAPAFDIMLAEGLDGAMEAVFARVKPGTLILLSPAAPSFGAFRDFAARGDAFQALCRSGRVTPAGLAGAP